MIPGTGTAAVGAGAARPGWEDLPVVLLAAGAWVGASVARPVPVAAAVFAAATSVVVAHRAGRTAPTPTAWRGRTFAQALVVALGVAVVASALGARAVAAVAPVAPRPFDGVVVLVGDPDDAAGAVRADVADDAGRYELWARGAAGRTLRDRLAGERVAVRGGLAPRPEGADGLARRHVVGRLAADALEPAAGIDPASALANGFRRLLARGAASLPPEPRALFAGFVLGDDRDQREDVADAFRASGLSHLLVVSGENVAFLLVVVHPLVSRLGRGTRYVALLGALVFFALLTRFEPSVLRATAMAAVAATGTLLGREVTSRRALALGVTGLLLVDPLLAGSLGFRLSVAASAGIIVGARPLAARLPGPRVLADAAAVTVAAQLAVAPVLLPVFGGLPLAALPANLLAAPAAGPVMVWGLTGGLVAGLVGGGPAAVLHLPTRVLLGWVAAVARLAAGLPLGELRAGHLAGLVALGAVVAVVRNRRWRRVALVGMVVVTTAAAAARPVPPPGPVVLGGATLWSAPGAVVVQVDGSTRLRGLLDGLRSLGVRRVDLVVARTGSRATGEVVAVLGRALPVGEVVGPPGNRFGASAPSSDAAWVLGDRRVWVRADGDRLAVVVDPSPAAADPARPAMVDPAADPEVRPAGPVPPRERPG